MHMLDWTPTELCKPAIWASRDCSVFASAEELLSYSAGIYSSSRNHWEPSRGDLASPPGRLKNHSPNRNIEVWLLGLDVSVGISLPTWIKLSFPHGALFLTRERGPFTRIPSPTGHMGIVWSVPDIKGAALAGSCSHGHILQGLTRPVGKNLPSSDRGKTSAGQGRIPRWWSGVYWPNGKPSWKRSANGPTFDSPATMALTRDGSYGRA